MLLPPPDISAAYVDEAKRPSKDFYNWIKSLYGATRNIGGLPFTNVLDFAAGDGNDDSTAIQAAIDATDGGIVFFPTPPAGFYGIGADTAITLPAGRAICLIGAGRGDTDGHPGTYLKAIEAIPAIITSDNDFFRHHRISNMTLNADLLADYCLDLPYVAASTFDNLTLLNAKVISFRINSVGSPNNVQENLIFNIRIDSPSATSFSDYPDYNFELTGSNNNISFVKASCATAANFHISGSNDNYVCCHGYGGDQGDPGSNFLVDGFENVISAWEADGGTDNCMYLLEWANIVTGGLAQGLSGSAKGIAIGDGVGNCIIAFTNFNDATSLVNNIYQEGTAGGSGNFQIGNFAGNQSQMLPERMLNPIAVSDLPAATTQLAGAKSIVNNATATTFNSVVAGGGGNTVPVFCTGAAWHIG